MNFLHLTYTFCKNRDPPSLTLVRHLTLRLGELLVITRTQTALIKSVTIRMDLTGESLSAVIQQLNAIDVEAVRKTSRHMVATLTAISEARDSMQSARKALKYVEQALGTIKAAIVRVTVHSAAVMLELRRTEQGLDKLEAELGMTTEKLTASMAAYERFQKSEGELLATIGDLIAAIGERDRRSERGCDDIENGEGSTAMKAMVGGEAQNIPDTSSDGASPPTPTTSAQP